MGHTPPEPPMSAYQHLALRAHARAQAYAEAALHLTLDWTDDPTERAEGRKLSDHFERPADSWTRRAFDLGYRPPTLP